MEENIPETCPFMKRCRKKMTYSDFKRQCNKILWVYCLEPRVVEWREQIEKKTAAEWKLVFELEK